jgi:solute carrier family 35 protein E1
MDTPGLKDRIGSTGNQFALSILLGTLCILPVWAWREGGRLGPSAATFS